jgi:flagellin-like hook-associated protein FlgL
VTLTADGRIDTTVAPGPALADQVGGEGLSGLEAAIDELDVVAERSVLAAVGLGASLGWLNLLEERLAEQSVEQAGTLSGIEDLDMARAITEFQHLEGAYEAALGGAARLVRLSLLDFLQ